MFIDAFLLSKAVPVLGLGGWMFLAAYNNFVDPNTNVTLLKNMMSLEQIIKDGDLGQGLIGRKKHDLSHTQRLLKCIAAIQVLIAALLSVSGILVGLTALGVGGLSTKESINIATFSVLLFMTMWIFFIVGGLWFGYWIKMGSVQLVHFTLLIVSVVVITMLNTSEYS